MWLGLLCQQLTVVPIQTTDIEAGISGNAERFNGSEAFLIPAFLSKWQRSQGLVIKRMLVVRFSGD